MFSTNKTYKELYLSDAEREMLRARDVSQNSIYLYELDMARKGNESKAS